MKSRVAVLPFIADEIDLGEGPAVAGLRLIDVETGVIKPGVL